MPSAISYRWVALEALECANEGRLASFLAVPVAAVVTVAASLLVSSNSWRETLRGMAVELEVVVLLVLLVVLAAVLCCWISSSAMSSSSSIEITDTLRGQLPDVAAAGDGARPSGPCAQDAGARQTQWR